jgi:hypothetical protein
MAARTGSQLVKAFPTLDAMAAEMRRTEFVVTSSRAELRTERHARRRGALQRNVAEGEVELARMVTEYGAMVHDAAAS